MRILQNGEKCYRFCEDGYLTWWRLNEKRGVLFAASPSLNLEPWTGTAQRFWEPVKESAKREGEGVTVCDLASHASEHHETWWSISFLSRRKLTHTHHKEESYMNNWNMKLIKWNDNIQSEMPILSSEYQHVAMIEGPEPRINKQVIMLCSTRNRA